MENNRISEVTAQTEDKKAETEDKTTGKENRTTESEGRVETCNLAAVTVRKEAKKEHKRREGSNTSWIFRGILVSAALAVFMICMYGFFHDRAEAHKTSPLENYDNIAWLYQNSYLLYKDLYNAQAEEPKDYKGLYIQPAEGYEWIVAPDAWDENVSAFQERYDSTLEGDDEDVSFFYTLRDGINRAEYFFQNLEEHFGMLNSNYDYVIRDNTTGFYLTNMSEADLQRSGSELFFQVSFEFNEHGVAAVGDQIEGVDAARIRKFSNEAIRSSSLEEFIEDDRMEGISRYGVMSGPADCTVVYCISQQDWASGQSQAHYMQWTSEAGSGYLFAPTSYIRASQGAIYREVHMGVFLLALLTAALVCGLFLPIKGGQKVWREVKICGLPLEPLLAIGIVLFGGIGGWLFDLAVYTAGGRMEEVLYQSVYNYDLAEMLSVLINLACFTAFFFCGWYLGVCARAVRELGVREYIRQKCIFYRIFPFIKRKTLEFYDTVRHFDVTRNSHKMILKIVLLNGVILFVISCFWVTGFPITVVYSILLYVILRKYVSDLQGKYGILLHAINEIAEGNLNVAITEDLGVFEPFKPQFIRIQNGFRNAVEEETKSQRMKAELITNVSHDLKTPLTAIITYINLLKDENITEQQRKEYLDTLERKSLRLKVLIEDLFEVSKANSQTITLNIMDVDIMNLVKQVSFEMTDKLAASGLDVRMNLTDEKIILPLDSQKTYRIYENLMGNIAKYALPGTRVYINGFRIDDTVIITMKNISAQEITVDTAELTERFVRGDASRNTEGSGLGLAIAKSFMELQGGELSLEVDGDLFKATTTWHVSTH